MLRAIVAGVLFLGLLACSTDRFVTHKGAQQPSARSVSSQQLADKLNARYRSTVAQCNGGTPAYYCSGIILRTSTYSPDFDFWTHSPPAAALGSLTFSYIRRDVGSNGTGIDSGFIFSDQETALAENKAQTLRCIYPFMASTQGAGRPGFGCGFIPTRSLVQDVDLSTCATLATPAITAPLWLDNFRRFGSDTRKQCSLSTLAPGQFKASLDAHNGVDAAHSRTRNELLIATWVEDAPEQLPIEAFFYNVANTKGVLNAQALRRAFYFKTGIYLPVVRVDFSVADKNIFSWHAADQINGQQVVEQLTQRYLDKRSNCGTYSLPAFLCSGIDLRGTRASDQYDSWNPSPTAERVGGVSFSFFRTDYKMRRLAFDYANGLIFYPQLQQPAGKIWINIMCFFPIDGISDNRPEGGCGASPSRPFSDRCDRVNVFTGEQWAAHYIQHGEVSANACSMDVRNAFIPNAGQNFSEGMRGGRLITPKTFEKPNDLKHEVWAQNIPAQLPIEAFFYVSPAGLNGAQHDQARFYELTGIIVPIISLKLPATLADEAKFSFSASDQVPLQ